MPDASTSRAPMSRTEIAQRVRGIIAEEAAWVGHSWPESATLASLDLDELDRLAVLVTVEDSFDIDLRDIQNLSSAEFGEITVGSFIDSVEGQVRAGCIS